MASIVFACYLPTLNNGFVWDDNHNYVENNNYRGLSLAHLRWMFTTFHDANYHPLAWLSLGLDFIIWEMNPAGYHLTSLVFHIFNTVLFYVLMVIFLRRSNSTNAVINPLMVNASAAAGALFFAVHPLRVETVAWVSVRSDVLCGFFYLLTIIAYVHMAETKAVADRRKWFFLALLFFVLSLLSRAWGMTLPLVLLILDLYPLGRFDKKGRSAASLKKIFIEKIPFALFALGGAILAFLAKKGSMLKVAEHGILERSVQAVYGLCFYPWKTALPMRISSFYLLDKNFNPMEPQFLVCALFVIGVTAGSIIMRHRWPWALTAWACYAVTVSPLLGFAQSGPQIVADRYTYIACMPFAALVSAGMLRICRERHGGKLSKAAWLSATSAIWVGLIILAVLSFRQTRIWRDDLTFWSHAIKFNASNYIAYNNRGVFLKDHEGDLALAVKDFTYAIKLSPEYVGAYYNRGLLHEKQGDLDNAIADYSSVIRLEPENDKAYNNRGGVLKKQGNLAGALADFNSAIRLNPSSPEGYANRGAVWLARNDFKRAIEDLNKALEVASADWVYKAQVEKILDDIQARLKDNSRLSDLK